MAKSSPVLSLAFVLLLLGRVSRAAAAAAASFPSSAPGEEEGGVARSILSPPEGHRKLQEATCSNGLPGIGGSNAAGHRVCCPLGCGQCGGSGCGTAGRPEFTHRDCCVNGVFYSQGSCADTGAAPCVIDDEDTGEQPEGTCRNGLPGIEGSNAAGHTVCCPLGCGQCGGSGCSTVARPEFTNRDCCVNGVFYHQGNCADTGAAPCIITNDVVVGTPSPVDPDTPAPVDPDTPAPVDPDTPAPVDPDTPAPVDPDTPAPVAPDTPAPVDPDTPAPVDPNTPAPVDPDTPAPVDPDTPAPVDPDTPAPVDPDTPAPVDPDTPAPVDPDTPAPVDPDTPAPVNPDTPAPVNPDTPAPVDPDTPAPVDPDTPAPVDPDTPAPVDPDTPAPVDPDTPAPVDPDTPAPVDPDTPAPVDPDTPAPVNPDTPAPVDPDTPAPVDPDTPSPVATTPTGSPSSEGNVRVDLVPCILATGTLEPDVYPVSSAYLFSEFFKGFWTATQIVQTVTDGDEVLDLVYADDADHGKCNVIFVGIVPDGIAPDDPTATLPDETERVQKIQLQEYSRKFKVRIVYLDASNSIRDPEVKTRLGMEDRYNPGWQLTGPSRIIRTGGPSNSVVPDDLLTDPTINSVYGRPVEQIASLPSDVSIFAQYADESGAVLPGFAFDGSESVSIAVYADDSGLEEMHAFLGIAWFDLGSWAWAHSIAEWGTRGVFQGERRFYLGAVVDDLFLTTSQWEYLPDDDFAGAGARLTAGDLAKYQTAEAGFGNVKTEFAYNGVGILDQVYDDGSWRSWFDIDADIALLEKGEKPQEGGIPQLSFLDWLSTTFNPADGETGMATDVQSGVFAADELLTYVQANLDAFYWQSHSFSHLARDNLGINDCLSEDAGNVQMAILLGLFDSDNYNWRSMTSPGITGLFNEYCLESGAVNLMMCYPGDNTYTLANTDPETVSLINEDNQFHSITTTVGTNGFAGVQIVPRFATYVYYNCVTGQCLVDENEKIRRDVCGCEELDPSLPKGDCSACTSDGVTNIESFNNIAELEDPDDPKPLQALFEREERDTSRYILSGRRDKYMFHQANVVSTEWTADTTDPLYVDPRPTDDPSLLEYWYIRVIAELSKYINTEAYPLETLKFDNLCHNFYQHEDLDASGAVLTAIKDTTSGDIIGMTLATADDNGAPIPLTVHTATAGSIGFGGLTPVSTETYGSDTTYIFAAGTLTAADLDKPSVDEVYQIPQALPTSDQSEAAQLEADAELEEATPELLETAEEANEQAEEVANEEGFVPS